MSDRFVTVASYPWTAEAQMAKNYLEGEGIPAFLAGELTGDALAGILGPTSEVQLQVREQDAARATSLLAAAAAHVTLEEDWEAKAERGLYVCSLCGMGVPQGESACPACGTLNERITTDRRDTWAAPPQRPRSEGVKKGDQVQPAPAAPVLAGSEDSPTGRPAGKGCALVLLALPVLLVWLWW